MYLLYLFWNNKKKTKIFGYFFVQLTQVYATPENSQNCVVYIKQTKSGYTIITIHFFKKHTRKTEFSMSVILLLFSMKECISQVYGIKSTTNCVVMHHIITKLYTFITNVCLFFCVLLFPLLFQNIFNCVDGLFM